MSKIDHTAGADALAILVEQHLAPTPENYPLAYIALTDPGSPIGQMVKAFTADGFRLRQHDAEEIIRLHVTGAVRRAPDEHCAPRCLATSGDQAR